MTDQVNNAVIDLKNAGAFRIACRLDAPKRPPASGVAPDG